jgi:hypothetical protein
VLTAVAPEVPAAFLKTLTSPRFWSPPAPTPNPKLFPPRLTVMLAIKPLAKTRGIAERRVARRK